MKRIVLIAIALSMLFSAASRADIYKWEDETGTVHFTDDLSNVPAAFRGKATAVIREAPPAQEPPSSAPQEPGTGQAQPAPAPAPSREDAEAAAAREKDALVSEIEQLKAKIAAKEKLVQFVSDRQNLILNPDRRRVIDPGDLELSKKYQAELPEDRQMLQDLENRLESLK
jgi:hypothetical protein